MIAVSICDIYNMSFVINGVLTDLDKCTLPKTFIFTMIDHALTILDGILRRLSSWIGIVMASIRYFAIKYPLNPTTDNLSKPVFALESISLLGTLSVIVSMSYWCHFWIEKVAAWVPGENCGYPVNFTAAIFGSAQSEFSIDYPLSLQVPQTADGVSQIIPLPVLTILLIKELRRTDNNRKKVLASKQTSSQTDHTTKMIMIMTVASTFSEGPIGLILIVQIFAGPSVTTITANLNVIFGAIVALNTITHCLVCIVISSRYRKTVLEVFMCKRLKAGTRITPNASVITLKRGA
ncbi:unnamed protein product [Caenorhabditis brenneri]